ncbi:MAG: hypothetical protein QM791_18915 [Ferruginibacter sp.]
MNWVPVKNHASALLQEFHLVQNNNDKMVLKYNPHQRSARFTSDGKHYALFYFETAGTVGSKILIQDQYGMLRGNIVTDKSHGNGHVELEGKKYNYQLKSGYNSPSIVIYERTADRPWLTCDLDLRTEDTLHASFIVGLCWHIFLQQEKDMLVDFAA